MTRRSHVVCPIVIAALLATSQAANAACTIDRVRPTGTLPTMASGQTFSFVATDDCDTFEFSTNLGAFRRTPTMGAVAGAGTHWYDVTLSAMEWRSLTGPTVTTFAWRASATGVGGTFRTYTTNELDLDRDGWTRSDGDDGTCDRAAAVNPGVTEVCGNEVDEDCDGQATCGLDVGDADANVDGSLAASHSGTAIAFADVDADGVLDLLNGAPGDGSGGRVYVSFGPLHGTSSADDDLTITPTAEGRAAIGDSLAGGDADDDGFDDVLVGAWDRASSASLLLGPITGDISTAAADLALYASHPAAALGFHMQITPDVDGDGASDIVITAPHGSLGDGVVYVVPGATTGFVEVAGAATYEVRGETGGEDYLGISAAVLGDTDGDGIDDLAMDGRSTAYVVPGGLPGGSYDARSVASATIDSLGGVYNGWGDARHLVGVDYERDGYGDLLVGDPTGSHDGIKGVVHLLAGPFAGRIEAGSDDVVTWVGDKVGDLVDAADVNGDGETDYLVAGFPRGYLSMGPVIGVVDVTTLPSFASAVYSGSEGAILFAPDWSGDGSPEIVTGINNRTTAAGVGAGAVYVFDSDGF